GAGAALGTFAIGATTIGCLLLGIAAVRAGRLPGPELAVLALTPLAAADLVAALPEAAARLLGARQSARRLSDLDARPAPVTDPAAPQPLGSAARLDAEALAVRWPDADADAVSGLSLRVGSHRGALLTGPSGAGKSTTIAAVLRNLDPSAGRITLDGLDTRHAAPDDVRARMAWCGPDTHLFDSSLRENLLLARPGCGDDDLRAALRQARLGGWLDSLPGGLDTALGAHGTAVSGGERQRIGVARALLADRPVLLLDEPTAHLDGHTAGELAADLRALAAGRAALIVTHRPEDFPDLPVITLARPANAVPVPHRLCG
ncbi:amino acid ABC transporter ATP-binding/permease protein, partial [Actinophytocola sp.]|uniref:amino acid ABC transporter ATP-binding/permease protein n=1 Tax=Actinophytocola sp. TaxID=1872138 RepID=UPI002D7EC9B0